MTLDASSSRLLAEMSAGGMPPLHHLDPPAARELIRQLAKQFAPGPEVYEVTDTRIRSGQGHDIPVRIFKPSERARGIIVYLHGGGWVLGALDDSDSLGRQLANRTGCTVMLVDYRLAPEHPFPAAVDDSWESVRWAAVNRTLLAGSDVPLVVAGDSAGGNLTAAVTRRARMAGDPAIAVQVLIYPVTDCDLDTPSYLDPANQLMVSREAMTWFWDHYLADESRRTDPEASPARDEGLAGAPPTVVLTAEHDPLRDEGERFAELLRAAGVPVQHRRFEGQMHGFFTLVDILPGSAAGLDYVVECLDRALGPDRA
jgi:acetyl esterase